MAARWVKKDTDALAELRSLLKDEIAGRPQYPDVVGDRRLLRFLRGKQYNIQETAKMYSAFLKWRDENNVDDIRNQILYGGLDSPYKFPNGKKIIDLAPQIVISAKAQDKKGQPLVLEQYSFSPADMLARVTVQDYLQFLIYSLEYRALVMEQLSHERELQYLAAHPNPEERTEGYGVVLLVCCIRDLQGVGLSHLTGKGKAIIEAAINIGLPNYPEYLGKCHMINVPWVFTSMWYFIKGLLDEYIIAKISFASSSYMDSLLKDIPIESIPKALGGKFYKYNESFAFDTSPTGPFHTERKLRMTRGDSISDMQAASTTAPAVNTLPTANTTSSTATIAAATSTSTSSATAVASSTTTATDLAAGPADLTVEEPSAHSAASLSPSSVTTHEADTTPVISAAATIHNVAHSTTERSDTVAPAASLTTYVDDEPAAAPSKPAVTVRDHGTTGTTATSGTHTNREENRSTTGSTQRQQSHGAHTAAGTGVEAPSGAVADQDLASQAVRAMMASPVAAALGVIVSVLFMTAPLATLKYVIVPLLFVLFVVYVI